MAKFEFVEWLFLWLLETSSFEFEWDAGNQSKSETKHGVATVEVEEVFQSGQAVPLGVQVSPNVSEERLGLVGPTAKNRLLHVVFALREGKIRPISARTAHRKERKLYEEFIREISKGV